MDLPSINDDFGGRASNFDATLAELSLALERTASRWRATQDIEVDVVRLHRIVGDLEAAESALLTSAFPSNREGAEETWVELSIRCSLPAVLERLTAMLERFRNAGWSLPNDTCGIGNWFCAAADHLDEAVGFAVVEMQDPTLVDSRQGSLPTLAG